MRQLGPGPGALLLLASCGGDEPVPAAPEAPTPPPAVEAPAEVVPDLEALPREESMAWLMEKGRFVYDTGGTSGVACVTCHMENGLGQPPTFPPLVGQIEHMGDCEHQGRLIVEGLEGELVVLGVVYNTVMPPQDVLSDVEIAAAVTYVRNSWGNAYGPCLPSEIAPARVKKVPDGPPPAVPEPPVTPTLSAGLGAASP